MTRHRPSRFVTCSAKKIAVYRTCEALITRTRTAESQFSVILTFLEGCTATDADVSEQEALHASTAENPHAQRRTSAHSRKTWSTADYMQSGRRVHEHRCVLASRAACWRTQSRVCMHRRMTANTAGCRRSRAHEFIQRRLLAGRAACWRTQPRVGEHGRVLADTVTCLHGPSYVCQHSRLLAFTRACVHTATAARMQSGETAFIDGNIEEEGRVRFFWHESVTERWGAVSCQRGR